jgi:hypothetical protein
MTAIADLIGRVVAGLDGEADAFDRLVASGQAAIPALVDTLAQDRAVPRLSAALAYLRVDDPVGVLGPLVASPSVSVAEAACAALAASGDPRAIPILAASKRRFSAARALGVLGRAEAIPILRDKVTRWLGPGLDALPPASWLASRAKQRDLRFLVDVAAALAMLGDQVLAPVAIHVAGLGDASEGAEVRAAAVAALGYATAPGVAGALARAARDGDDDVAVAALLGSLYLGRIDEVPVWIAALARSGVVAATARWCLEAFAGEHSTGATVADAEAWWSRAGARFAAGVCYRDGRPADPGALVARVAADPSRLRTELRVHTAAPIADDVGGSLVTPGEQRMLDAWWQANAARFPAGQLHRWGRTFEPGAVD